MGGFNVFLVAALGIDSIVEDVVLELVFQDFSPFWTAEFLAHHQRFYKRGSVR